LTAGHFFHAADGRLRAPWRITIFILAAVAGIIVASSIVSPAITAMGALLGVRFDVEYLALALGLIAAHVASVRWVDRTGWRMVYLDRSAAEPRRLLTGAAVGALAIALPSLLLLGIGWLRTESAAPGSWLGAALRMTLVLAPAALWEELAFRGYLFQVLRASAGAATAVVVTSLLFALIHLSNPGADARSTALVMIAGIFLGAVLLATRSLYAAWMAHLAWNWVMAVLLHAAVSGAGFDTPDYRVVDAGPDWATGGVWGPEGGAAAALGMLGGLLFLGGWLKTPPTRATSPAVRPWRTSLDALARRLRGGER
jgi:membrane protease YdiL (CAAX protease family)